MIDDFEALSLKVAADTRGFQRDIEAMRASLVDGLGAGAAAAGRGIEQALARAARSGRLEFEALARGAARALGEVAAAALKLEGGVGGGLAGLGSALAAGLLGAPGRAIGGPVAPGRPYWVGERGPELFVPTTAGRVEPAAAARTVNVRVTLAGGGQGNGRHLAATGRQLAAELKRALGRLEG
ncbi:MAG: tail tape measure protein [Sphingomonadaceae bacterium]